MTSGRTPTQGDPGEQPVRAAVPLPWLLRRVNQRYRASIRDRLVESGLEDLPQPGYWALMVLARGGTGANQLMREMGVSKQAVSKLVDALVTSGFVVRKPDHADRRRTNLVLSAKGRKAARVIDDVVQVIERAFIEELGEAQYETLVQMLAQLASRHEAD